jgi:hypothetical protein
MRRKSNSKARFRKRFFIIETAGTLLRFFAKTLWRAQTDRQCGAA